MQGKFCGQENFFTGHVIPFGYNRLWVSRIPKPAQKEEHGLKRSLTLLLASLLLVFSLTACGRNNQNGSQNGAAANGQTAGNNETTAPADNNTNNGTEGSMQNGTNNNVGNNAGDNAGGNLVDDTGDVLQDIGNGTQDVLDDAGRALTGGTAGRSVNPTR